MTKRLMKMSMWRYGMLFDAATRQLEDYSRIQRGEVKTHQ